MLFDEIDKLQLKILSTKIDLSIKKEKYKLNHQPYILFEIRNTIKYLTRLKVKLEKKLKIEKLNDDFNFF